MRQKTGGSREEHMQGHANRALFSEGSNKEACNMKAQGHAAHRSTQDGVAGLPVALEVFKHAP